MRKKTEADIVELVEAIVGDIPILRDLVGSADSDARSGDFCDDDLVTAASITVPQDGHTTLQNYFGLLLLDDILTALDGLTQERLCKISSKSGRNGRRFKSGPDKIDTPEDPMTC